MTHDDFLQSDNHRLIATFPLSGRTFDAYSVWIVDEAEFTEHYAVCDNHGYCIRAGLGDFQSALNLCLRNCGWGVRAHEATEIELAYR